MICSIVWIVLRAGLQTSPHSNYSTSDRLVLDELWRHGPSVCDNLITQITRRTLDLGNGTGKDLLLRLLVVEVLEHVLDDGLDEVGLLALLRLLLEADPAVEDGLDLGRERNLLALDESLGLELRGLLQVL